MYRNLSIILFILIIAASAGAEQEDAALDFTLEDIEGELLSLSDFLGRGPILIDFWATWCAPCKTAMPHLQEIYDKYAERGFEILAISEDSPRTQSRVRPFIMSKRFTFKVLLDPNGEVLKQFQGNTLPFQVILDSEGNILETHQGYTPGDEKLLDEKIAKLLKIIETNE